MLRNSVVMILGILGIFTATVSHAEESICAVVKIEIRQEMTIERQGFEAQMKIINKLDTLPMNNIQVEVYFQDESGQPVLASSDPDNTTAQFFIRVSSVDGLRSSVGGAVTVEGNSYLPASGTGDIRWLIIPAQNSGGGTPEGRLYQVGATLKFSLGGENNELSVTPDTIRVRPMPLLKLDYFITREVRADDPMTSVKEPIEPFTLGIRIRNSGGGIGRNIRIESAHPKIADNRQGLPIDFRITASYINDQPTSPSLLVNFGNIASGKSAMGRWIMETDYAGTFTEFTASYSHASELGGELTSLIDGTPGAHLLVRDVRVDLPGRDGVKDFLAYSGDVLRLYESDAYDDVEVQVLTASVASLTAEGNESADHHYRIRFDKQGGFVHVKLPDPFAGSRVIRSVNRADGKSLLSDNFWISRTKKQQASEGWDYFINLFDEGKVGDYRLILGPKITINRAPEVRFVAHQITYETGTLVFPISANDPDGQIPSLTASQLPNGAVFTDQSSGTALFTWNPIVGQAGRHSFTVVASDGALQASRTISLQVNPWWDTDGDGLSDAWEIEHFGNLDRDGTGDFDGDGISDLQEFKNETDPTVPNGAPAPQIVSPRNYQEITNRAPQLEVKNSPKAQVDHFHTYRFALYSDAEHTQKLAQNLTIPEGDSNTIWQLSSELADNRWYYWSANVFNGYLESPTVFGRFFVNTQNDAPTAATPEQPADGASVESLSPLLIALNGSDIDGDALSYVFEVYADLELTQLVTGSESIAEGATGHTSWQISSFLEESQLYYWQVIVTDEHGLSTTSALASFSINQQNSPPGRPEILSPEDAIEITTQTVQLQATVAEDPDDDELTYIFQLAIDAEFSQPTSSPALSGNGQIVVWDLPLLEDNTRYYWRVKAMDPEQAESDWSFAQFFVNTANDAPGQPGIIAPASQSWVDILTPMLEVTSVIDLDQDPITYRFQIWGDAEMRHPIVEGTSLVPHWKSSQTLDDNTWYYWRARAEDPHDASSEWTSLTRFFVNLNGIDDPPTITLLEPQGETHPDAQNQVTIRWSAQDPDSNAQIALYYSNALSSTNRILIVDGLLEDDQIDTYFWNVSGLTPGNYTVYATINDGNHQAESTALGYVVVEIIILTIDNDDTQNTHHEGEWVSSTKARGYWGTDYLMRVGDQPQPADGIVLDNQQAIQVGNWISSTSGRGYWGDDYQYHVDGDPVEGGIVVDNSDGAFSSRGNWVVSTSAKDFIGPNYHYHELGQIPESALVLDDTDPTFSTTGEWENSTAVSGYEGQGYRTHAANGETPDVLIIDNQDAAFSTTGVWQMSDSISGYFGNHYHYHLPAGRSADAATWTINLPQATRGKLYARWPADKKNSKKARFTVIHRRGERTVTVNQTRNGGTWQLLGTYDLLADGRSRVILTADSRNAVIADAIKFVPESGSPNRAIWTPVVPGEAVYTVYAKWTEHKNRATNAQYTIHHLEGSSTIRVNQRQNGGQWQKLGSWPFKPGAGHRIELSDQANGYVIADAIALVSEYAVPNAAIWTPSLPNNGEYDVYVSWPAHRNRARNAQYTIYHVDGQNTVVMDHMRNRNKWNLLGRYSMNTDQGHRVELTDQADGYVIADAVAFVPVEFFAYMTWQPNLIEADTYEVYARWTTYGRDRWQAATNAQYIVHHAQGETSHTLNQKTHSSRWNLLGVYALDDDSRITLRGDGNGTVIGDAILMIPTSRANNDHHWYPPVTVDGLYRVSARWPTANRHSDEATWHLKSGSDTRTVTVNQRQRGGEWVELGELFIRAEEGITITLSSRAKGILAADAVRLEYIAAQP